MRRYNAITGKFEDDEEQNVNTTSVGNNSVAQYNAIENTFVKPTVSLEQPKEEKNISTFAKDVFSKNREIANGILSQKSDNNLDSQANNEIKLKSSKEYYKQFLQEYEKDTGHDFESDMSSKDYDAGITIRGNLTRLSNKEKIERAEKYAQESKTYKQYLEAVDREKAEKQQKLEEKVASHETNAWDATGRQFTSQVLPAVKDLLLGFGATADPLNKEKYEQKAKDAQPTESQLIADKAYQENKNPILKVGQDLLRTTGNMVPSLAVSAINPTAGLMTTGFSSGGSGFRQAIQEGKNYDEAYVYGALEGAKEATFQKLLGGISAFGNSTAKKVLGNNIDQAFAKLIKNPTARMYIGDMISEGSEEYLQEILEPVVRNLAFGENNEFKLVTPEALYSGFLGTLNSGILNAPSAIKNNRNLSQYSDENSIAKNPQNNENVSNMENSSIQNANISQELKQEIQNKTREQNQNNSNVEFVPIQDILPYKSNGGYRTEDQINDLETNIRQNGITNPIELIRENDGTIRIENGNHRLEVAQRLGLEEVPIVFVDSIENIDNTSYNNVKTLVKGEYNGNGNHENTRTFSENNASEQFINGNSRNNSEQFNDRRTATRNDRLYQQMVGYNNRPSSNTTRQQNSVQSEAKGLDTSSFSYDKTARRYDDLQQATRIDYTVTSDGDINTIMYDKDGNLINQIVLYDKNMANKEYGSQIGDYLFSNSSKQWQTINLNNSNENTNNTNDYFMDHRPTETGLTADDLTNQNAEYTIPTDVYERPEIYFMMNEKATQESMSVLNKVRNNPNAKVTIYRATTGNEINNGDWVTLSKTYAEEHNDRQFDGKGNIVSKEVSVKDIQYAGDDINEFGYFPKNDNKNNSKTELNENKQDDVLTIKQDNNVTSETSNNSKGDGESRFYRNITERSEFLTQENRDKLSTEDYIKYYDKVSNKESMEGALQRLNKGGQAELTRWFAKGSDDKAFSNLRATWDSTDVAEGWILLKRAQDNQDYDMMVEVAKKMREIGTKSGQAVQMYNVLSRLTPEGMVKYATSELDEAWQIASKNKSKKWWDKHIDDFQLKPEETQFIIDQMNKVEKMEDGYKKNVEIAKVQKMLQDKLPPQKGQGLKSWMRVSMLLNPKTQVRNVVGNALIAPVNAVADRFSAMADRMISRKTGVRTTGKTNWKNYGKGFGRGLYQSYNDFKQGINTRNVQGNRFEIGQGKSFNENHKGFLSKPRNAISKSLNRVDRFLSFVLDAGDRGFYEASFTNSINNQLALNNTTEVTQDMIDIATNEALSRTWQDNNNYTKFVLDVRRGMNKINIKGYGLGDILIPFAKTPANLTKAIVDYSPIGLTKTLIADGIKLKNNISNGTVTAQQQHRFVQNLGKATAGTMLYILGFALAQAGITSGANDDDKDVSDFMRNTLGIQPYSIKIGNHSFTYDWAQPIAAPFAITADITRALKDDEVSLQDAITTSLDSGFNILLEQSFLSSIQDVLNSSYGSTTENIIDQILGLPARGVSTFIKQINDMIDSKTRMVYERDQPFESAKNQIKTKIPGLSQDLPVKRDTLGREIEKYGGENNFFNVFINPANISKGKVSESAKEIYDVYQATKDKTIMPRSAPNDLSMTITKKDGTKKKKELVLDNKDKSEFLKISGGIVDKNVKKLKDNKYYKKLNDDEKALVIKEIVDYSYNKAKADLLDIDMSEVSGYKTVTKKLKGGMALYDYYAQEIYKNR